MNDERTNNSEHDELLPIGDVAKAFGVTVATVRNWDRDGRINSTRTPGGQRRFRRSDVESLLEAASQCPAGRRPHVARSPYGWPHRRSVGPPSTPPTKGAVMARHRSVVTRDGLLSRYATSTGRTYGEAFDQHKATEIEELRVLVESLEGQRGDVRPGRRRSFARSQPTTTVQGQTR